MKTFVGTFTSDGNAKTINIGCEVGYVKIVNVTANTVVEVFNDGTTIKQMSQVGSTGVITQGGTNVVVGLSGITIADAFLALNDVVTYVAQRLE